MCFTFEENKKNTRKIRIKDLNASIPEMEILINGSDQNIFSELLTGLQLDAENKFKRISRDVSKHDCTLPPVPAVELKFNR